jgi:hypothetical protein
MTLRNVLFAFAGVSAIVHVASYIMIMAALDRRGHKTNVLLARWHFGRYLRAYKEATVRETGKPGLLYGVCIGAILVTLVCVVAAILATGQ